MRNLRPKLALALALLIVGPYFEPAYSASVKGRRNTAIGLGAATAYHAIKGHKREAIGLGVGTAVAYHRYRKARKRERLRRSAVTRSESRRTSKRSSRTKRYAKR